MSDAVAEANRMAEECGYVLLDQFSTLDNSKAHYLSTGPEILCEAGSLDAFITGVGTGRRHYYRCWPFPAGTFAFRCSLCCRAIVIHCVLSGKPAGPILFGGLRPALCQSSSTVLFSPVSCPSQVKSPSSWPDSCLLKKVYPAGYPPGLKLATLPEFRGKRIATVLPNTSERYLSTRLFQD